MKSRLFLLSLVLLPVVARTETPLVFSPAPVVFRENDLDRRFVRTRLYRALYLGLADPACAPAIGGLLTVVAEAAPRLHQKDENFVLDETLLEALRTQLSTDQFPGSIYFTLMMRRVRLEGKLPFQWLETAARVQPYVRTIDLGKLRMLAEGVKPVESAYFSLPMFRERYEVEVARASSAAGAGAWDAFKDAYLDHDVAFSGLSLVDVKAGVKIAPMNDTDPAPPPVTIATAEWLPPDPNEGVLSLAPPKARLRVVVTARLTPRQYFDISKLPKGHRVLLRGRLWGVNPGVTEVELRDAQIFEDRDWSQGTALANPNALALCPIAVNDLTGIAGGQPGGFGH